MQRVTCQFSFVCARSRALTHPRRTHADSRADTPMDARIYLSLSMQQTHIYLHKYVSRGDRRREKSMTALISMLFLAFPLPHSLLASPPGCDLSNSDLSY